MLRRRPLARESYRGGLVHLRDERHRMKAQIGNLEAKLAVARCELGEAYGDLDSAVVELRRLRGLLGAVSAADRAMPEPQEAAS